MKKNNSFYKRFLIISQAILLIITFLALFFVVTTINNNYTATSKKLTEDVTKSYLKNEVDSLASRIDYKYDSNLKLETYQVSNIKFKIENSNDSNDTLINNLQDILKTSSDNNLLNLIAVDSNYKVLYTTNSNDFALNENTNLNYLNVLSINTVIFEKIERVELTFYLYIKTNEFDSLIKEEIKEEIHNQDFSNSEYIWVNEVIDWNGGNNYAIRYIHPNLIETEGDFLSTNTSDGHGNFPYKAELDGIIKDGEFFQSYYFKNINNNDIEQKLTYAKKYSRFNWIICSGKTLNEIYTPNLITEAVNNSALSKTLIYFAITIIIIYSSNLLIFILIQRKYLNSVNSFIKIKTEKDTLTRSLTRNAADIYFNSFDRLIPLLNTPLLFIMIDLDDFKLINDKY